MRPVNVLLDAYAADHQNPANRVLHTICVPIIVIALLGLLRSLPVPAPAPRGSVLVNWATMSAALALAWYLRLSVALAAGMAVALLLALGATVLLARLPMPLWAGGTPAVLSARPALPAGRTTVGA